MAIILTIEYVKQIIYSPDIKAKSKSMTETANQLKFPRTLGIGRNWIISEIACGWAVAVYLNIE